MRGAAARMWSHWIVALVALVRLVYAHIVKTITSTEAKTRLNALLAEVQRSGASVMITNHGRPVAVLSPAKVEPRSFGQLPSLVVPDTFDEPLPADEIAAWEPAQ